MSTYLNLSPKGVDIKLHSKQVIVYTLHPYDVNSPIGSNVVPFGAHI